MRKRASLGKRPALKRPQYRAGQRVYSFALNCSRRAGSSLKSARVASGSGPEPDGTRPWWSTQTAVTPAPLCAEHIHVKAVTNECSFGWQHAGSAERQLKDLWRRLFRASCLACKEDVEKLVDGEALELGSLAVLQAVRDYSELVDLANCAQRLVCTWESTGEVAAALEEPQLEGFVAQGRVMEAELLDEGAAPRPQPVFGLLNKRRSMKEALSSSGSSRFSIIAMRSARSG